MGRREVKQLNAGLKHQWGFSIFKKISLLVLKDTPTSRDQLAFLQGKDTLSSSPHPHYLDFSKLENSIYC
jgi:hypothetical protein